MKRIILIAFVLTFSAPAYAYLDPGTGSAVLSAIIGAIAAIFIAIKTYWYKLKSIFSRKKDDKSANDEQI